MNNGDINIGAEENTKINFIPITSRTFGVPLSNLKAKNVCEVFPLALY